MFTYYPAHTTAAQPELVNAIAQGLHAEHGVVTEDDILRTDQVGGSHGQ